jgi:cupin 2 domain-containing protein
MRWSSVGNPNADSRRRRARDGVMIPFLHPDGRPAEQVAILLTRSGLRVERIVSQGQASPPGFCYDQTEGEWLLVLAGAAKLRFADEPETRLLRAGDWLDIAPRRRHRVAWTDPLTPTVWLAVFYS